MLAIYFLWIACVFDPVGKVFGMKFLALLSVAVVLLFRFVLFETTLRTRGMYFWCFLLFVVGLPTYGLAVGLLRGGLAGGFVDTGYLSAAVYIMCAMVYFHFNSLEVGFAALVLSLRLLCVAIWAVLVVVATTKSNGFTNFLLAHGIAFLGAREYAGLGFFYIYFVASPMLIFLLCYEAWKFADQPGLARFLLLALPVSAMFLSGTRASIGIALFGMLFVWLWRRYGKGMVFAMLGLGVMLLLVALYMQVPVLADMFSTTERSNSAKLDYLPMYVAVLDDPLTFLFGQGFNAQVWSPEFADVLDGEATRTELTYLEAVRVFGIVVALLLVGCMIALTLSDGIGKGRYPWVAPALFLYLIMAGLNPYIFSSNGMLLIGLAAVAAGNAARPRRASPDASPGLAVAAPA